MFIGPWPIFTIDFIYSKNQLVPGPSKGCQLNLRDGELTPFRNHLAPLWRCWYLAVFFAFCFWTNWWVAPPQNQNFKRLLAIIEISKDSSRIFCWNPTDLIRILILGKYQWYVLSCIYSWKVVPSWREEIWWYYIYKSSLLASSYYLSS